MTANGLNGLNGLNGSSGLKLKLRDGSKLYAATVGDRVLRRGARTHTSAAEYGAQVAHRLERWKRVDPMVMRLPIGFHDRITNELTIQFGWTERLKLLLGFNLRIRMSILCANRPGRVSSSERLDLVWLDRDQQAGKVARSYAIREQESALSHSEA